MVVITAGSAAEAGTSRAASGQAVAATATTSRRSDRVRRGRVGRDRMVSIMGAVVAGGFVR
jgi:hypothetical protein